MTVVQGPHCCSAASRRPACQPQHHHSIARLIPALTQIRDFPLESVIRRVHLALHLGQPSSNVHPLIQDRTRRLLVVLLEAIARAGSSRRETRSAVLSEPRGTDHPQRHTEHSHIEREHPTYILERVRSHRVGERSGFEACPDGRGGVGCEGRVGPIWAQRQSAGVRHVDVKRNDRISRGSQERLCVG